MWELLSVDKRVYGQASVQVANDSDRFGRYLASKQSYGQAEQLLKKALSLKERSRGRDHPEIAGWVGTATGFGRPGGGFFIWC